MQLVTIEASLRHGNSVVRTGHQNGRIKMLAPKAQPLCFGWIFLSLIQRKHFWKVSGKGSTHLLHFLATIYFVVLPIPGWVHLPLILKDTGNCLITTSDCHTRCLPTSLQIFLEFSCPDLHNVKFSWSSHIVLKSAHPVPTFHMGCSQSFILFIPATWWL